MKRTPIRERTLPDYTRGEEIMNMVTHIVGGAMGVVILVLCVVLGALHHNAWAVVSGAIYGSSMIALYTISSVYHGLRNGTAKKVLQAIDHCMIYVLIAGTYTPVLLTAMRVRQPALSWVIFGVEWGLTALAITLTAIDLKKYRYFSMACYLGMGWMIVLALKPTLAAVGWAGFWWLLAGGVAYTVGAILYGIGGKKRYFHSVFHIFVDLGSLLQAMCILLYVM